MITTNDAVFTYDPTNDYAHYCIDIVNSGKSVEVNEAEFKRDAFMFLCNNMYRDDDFTYLIIDLDGVEYKTIVLEMDAYYKTFVVLLPEKWRRKYLTRGFGLKPKSVKKTGISFKYVLQKEICPSHIKQTRSINDKE